MAANVAPEVQKDSPSSRSPSIDHSYVQTDIAMVHPNFLINPDVDDEGQCFVKVLGDVHRGKWVPVANLCSKLSVSFPGKLYGKIDVTAKRPSDLTQGSEPWKAFVQELQFVSTQCCYWHCHPNVIQHRGLVFLKEAGHSQCVPYLLSEPVTWNLQAVLEDKQLKLSERNKISIVHGIANGLKFLHSRKPRAIIHAALVPNSVLLNSRGDPKLYNFFHAGSIDDPLCIKSEHHKPNMNPNRSKGIHRLEYALDMSSLGYIIKAIDIEHKNREQSTGGNVLENLYVLFDCVDGPPEELTAGEVCRVLTSVLKNPPRQPQGTQSQQQTGPQLSVSLKLDQSQLHTSSSRDCAGNYYPFFFIDRHDYCSY